MLSKHVMLGLSPRRLFFSLWFISSKGRCLKACRLRTSEKTWFPSSFLHNCVDSTDNWPKEWAYTNALKIQPLFSAVAVERELHNSFPWVPKPVRLIALQIMELIKNSAR